MHLERHVSLLFVCIMQFSMFFRVHLHILLIRTHTVKPLVQRNVVITHISNCNSQGKYHNLHFLGVLLMSLCLLLKHLKNVFLGPGSLPVWFLRNILEVLDKYGRWLHPPPHWHYIMYAISSNHCTQTNPFFLSSYRDNSVAFTGCLSGEEALHIPANPCPVCSLPPGWDATLS